MKTKISTNKVKLAKKRYYVMGKGAEVDGIGAYAILINKNGIYVNPFNVLEDLTVYDRSPYTNTTLDGEDYGNKIFKVYGEEKEGVCYVLDRCDMQEVLKKEEVTLEELEKYIKNSDDKFFIDRVNLFNNSNGKYTKQQRKLIASDLKKIDAFNEFVDSHNTYQYKKEQNR